MRRTALVGMIAAALLALAGAAYAATVTCEGGDCQGTEEADEITGSLQSDSIFADEGDDDVNARTGHDFVRGAEGDDKVDGGGGFDTLRGNRGADRLRGGHGDDFIFGNDNPSSSGDLPDERLLDPAPNDEDAVYGGAGFDLIDVNDGDGDDYVDCGTGGAFVSADKRDVLDCEGVLR